MRKPTPKFDRVLGFILAILTAALFMLPFLMIEQSIGRTEWLNRKVAETQRQK